MDRWDRVAGRRQNDPSFCLSGIAASEGTGAGEGGFSWWLFARLRPAPSSLTLQHGFDGRTITTRIYMS